jgi:hypothetical protein
MKCLECLQQLLILTILIGEPVNRYRGQYKDMDKLKSLFFESIGNTPDLDKYVDFTNGLTHQSQSFWNSCFQPLQIMQMNLRTVVESHVLERNAYRNKFPTLESKQEDPEVPTWYQRAYIQLEVWSRPNRYI